MTQWHYVTLAYAISAMAFLIDWLMPTLGLRRLRASVQARQRRAQANQSKAPQLSLEHPPLAQGDKHE